MKDGVQAEQNKKLGNLLASMREKAFKNGNQVQQDSTEIDEQEKLFLMTNTKKLEKLAAQIDGKSTVD